MWETPVHNKAIINEVSSVKGIIQLTKIMMKDTTYLLDESLVVQKRIHTVQVIVEYGQPVDLGYHDSCFKDDLLDTVTWGGQSQEQQISRLRQLSVDGIQCRLG